MIANTFIRRPVTAIVISLVIMLVGILAILNLPVGQYPDITPPTVQVSWQFYGRGCADGGTDCYHTHRNAGKWNAGYGLYAKQQHQ